MNNFINHAKTLLNKRLSFIVLFFAFVSSFTSLFLIEGLMEEFNFIGIGMFSLFLFTPLFLVANSEVEQ